MNELKIIRFNEKNGFYWDVFQNVALFGIFTGKHESAKERSFVRWPWHLPNKHEMKLEGQSCFHIKVSIQIYDNREIFNYYRKMSLIFWIELFVSFFLLKQLLSLAIKRNTRKLAIIIFCDLMFLVQK